MAYDGGKAGAGVYQTIINQMPPHETYIEPFLGDGAILRRKLPAARSMAVEIDGQVLAAWNGDEVPGLELYRANGIEWLKHEFKLLQTQKPAARASGVQFSDPPAAATIPAAVAIDAGECVCGRAAAGVALVSGEVLHPSGRDAKFGGTSRTRTLIYCDPPYPLGTRRNGAKLYRHEMTDENHVDLLHVLVQLPCMVLVSSYWSDLYGDMLAGWRLMKFKNQTRRGPATECLWANFPKPTQLHDSRFVGRNKRERERIRRRARNWRRALERIPPLERQAILDALAGGW